MRLFYPGGADVPKVVIKEWLNRRESTLPKPDLVEATPMEWLVPPVQRLWLGREPEDKTMRLRAFLSCMYSDSPAMLKTTYVPRHAIILCCVLRYVSEDQSINICIQKYIKISKLVLQRLKLYGGMTC